jgi:hypothetical protein
MCIDVCNSIHFDWINKHTISIRPYNSLRRSRHVITCWRQSVSCFQTVEVQGRLFAGATSVHCQILPGNSFLHKLQESVYRYIPRYFCVKQIVRISFGKPFGRQRNSSLSGTKHDKNSKCIAQRGELSQHIMYHCSFQLILP